MKHDLARVIDSAPCAIGQLEMNALASQCELDLRHLELKGADVSHDLPDMLQAHVLAK
jgi:hypothetical protein